MNERFLKGQLSFLWLALGIVSVFCGVNYLG